MPQLQKKVIQRINKRPKLIVMDTMNFWMETQMVSLMETIALVDVLTINDSEARQLTHEYSLVKAAQKILKMGPKYLIIKKGEHGALLFHGNNVFFAPQFTNPAGYGIGRNTATGFSLQSTSPCIARGLTIANNGGYDFFNTALSPTGNPDVGAIKY